MKPKEQFLAAMSTIIQHSNYKGTITISEVVTETTKEVEDDKVKHQLIHGIAKVLWEFYAAHAEDTKETHDSMYLRLFPQLQGRSVDDLRYLLTPTEEAWGGDEV